MVVASSDGHNKKGKKFDLLIGYPCEAWINFIGFSCIHFTTLTKLLIVEMYCRWMWLSFAPTALGLHTEHRPNIKLKKAASLAMSGSCLCVHVASWVHRQGLLVFVWRILPRNILFLQWLIYKIQISFLHKKLLWGKRKCMLWGGQTWSLLPRLPPNQVFLRGCEAQKGTCPSQIINHLCQEVSISALLKPPGNIQDLQLLLLVSLAVCVGVQALQRGTLCWFPRKGKMVFPTILSCRHILT